MVDLNTVLQIVPALGVIVALLYYTITIRNTDKQRRKDFIFQSNLARTTEFFNIFYKTYEMWDYDTIEDFNRKFNAEERAKFNWLVNVFNIIGTLMIDGVASRDEIMRLYPINPIIHLFEVAYPWIRDIRASSGNSEYMMPFEELYLEARRRLPEYVPHWQKDMRLSREIHQ